MEEQKGVAKRKTLTLGELEEETEVEGRGENELNSSIWKEEEEKMLVDL